MIGMGESNMKVNLAIFIALMIASSILAGAVASKEPSVSEIVFYVR